MDLIFHATYIASKVGKTGLTVTVDVDKILRSDGTRTAVATAASATEGRNGHYWYRVASVTDLVTYDYVACFKTADSTVDTQHLHSGWMDFPTAYDTQLAYLTGNTFERLGAPTGASVSADVATLLERIIGTLLAGNHNPQSGDTFTRIGTNGAGLTALGDTRLGNLDASVSSRSTYAGGDTPGVTTLLDRLTSLRAGYLDLLNTRLDAAVSSRLASSGYTAPPTASDIRSAIGLALANLDMQLSTINSKTANLPSDPSSQSAIQTAIDAIDPAALEAILNKLDTMLIESGLNWAFTTDAFSNFVVDNVDLGDEAISAIAYSIGVQLLQMATSRYVMSLQNPPTKSVDVNKYATWSMSAAYGDSAFDVAFLTMKSTLSLGDDAAELQVSYTSAGNVVVTKVAGAVVPDGATVVDDTINKRLLITVNTVALGLLATKTYKTDVKIVGDPESVVLASLEVALKDGVTRSTGV